MITLLRCVGWLSRGDLLTRAANAGPTKATPAAQCHGTYRFRYSIIPHPGTWADAFLQAHEFVTPMRALLAWGGAPTRASQSLVSVEPAQVVVSSVKQAEEEEGLAVRVYNPLVRPVDLRLETGLPFQTATLANLREEPDSQEHASTGARIAESGRLVLKLAGKRIQTILFR